MPKPLTTLQRAAIYARVSTTRQAEADLSIPDQVRQIEEYCRKMGWQVVGTFIEPGASATDDKRPQFQAMIDLATSTARPVDVVVVHSMSRFFRDQYQSEFYIRRLRKARVDVVSITQPFQDDPTGNLIRQILGNFDEYQSRENAKHTSRAMNENARQGFWNGARSPFGYHTVVAEQRGVKVKKRLAINDVEAAVVRRIYDCALGRHGPVIGIKSIVNRLNSEGVSLRGKPFQISNVHRILTSSTYAGTHHFNTSCSRTGEVKDRSEWIDVAVPAIVSRSDFDLVQASLAARSPKNTPPRVVNTPTLLTGVAKCATCGSGMTTRTGKSGQYRYYACAGCAQKGKSVCRGRSIPMATLDGMILEQMANRLFTPQRLTQILEGYIEKSAEADSVRKSQLTVLRARETENKGKINRLLGLVANGTMDADDPQMKSMLGDLKAQGHAIAHEIAVLERSAAATGAGITTAKIEKFGALLRDALRNDDPAFRRAYLRLFVESVVVDDREIRVRGPKDALANAAFADEPPSTAAVPIFVRDWHPVPDSNRC